jgi:hypothetical protein
MAAITISKTLNRLGCNRNASYFSFNLGGECPIKRPNTYQHQFEMYNNNYTGCAKMVGKKKLQNAGKTVI